MGLDDGNTEYEIIRKQRLEENRRRMQELGISELYQSLSKSVQNGNIKQTKRVPKDEFLTEVRRSSRVLGVPRPNYSDDVFDIRLPRRSGPRISALPRRYASDIERIRVAERANKLNEEMQTGNPSFVKLMLISHVSGGFWLGLPLKFCKKHLPRDDGTMILEDENGEEWESVYLAHRTGLSGGWRGFAIDHHLEDGDAIIFELIKPKRFKVHIIRVSEVMSEDDNKENAMGLKAGQKRKSLEKKNRMDDNKESAMKLKAGQKRKSLEKKNRKDDNKENAMQLKAGQKRKSFEKKKSGEELKTGSKTAQKELAKKRKNGKELAATNKSRENLKSVNRK